MTKIEINKFGKFERLRDMLLQDDYIIDLNDCGIKDRKRILDFFVGLTFYNGFIKKINKNIFEIRKEVSYAKK